MHAAVANCNSIGVRILAMTPLDVDPHTAPPRKLPIRSGSKRSGASVGSLFTQLVVVSAKLWRNFYYTKACVIYGHATTES